MVKHMSPDVTKALHYVFDPLCGWCYGAGRTVAALATAPELKLNLLPSGLFSGDGARPMDHDFAAYAWSNDQRIERLTGQRFSDRYRREVLADTNQAFDSSAATVALTAVALTEPGREPDALKEIQQARYVDGKNITQVDTLIAMFWALGLNAAASLLEKFGADLVDANRDRIGRAQKLLQTFDARGVPSFILEQDGQQKLLHSSMAYSNPQAFIDQLSAS